MRSKEYFWQKWQGVGGKRGPDDAGLIGHVRENLFEYQWEATERILGK